MRRLYHYLNPLDHLGDRNYSVAFPTIVTATIYFLLEAYQFYVLHNFQELSQVILFTSLFLVVYFTSREGIRGGLAATIITGVYYVYYAVSRSASQATLQNTLVTIVVLLAIYIMLNLIIGLLKQTIDTLIDREVIEKRRLQIILEQLPVGVMITDNRGRLMQSNKRLEEILDIKISDGFRMDNYPFISNTSSRSQNQTFSLVQALQKGGKVASKEYVYDHKNGKRSFLQVNVAPIRGRSGKIIAVASIINDITVQKEMEKRKDDFVNMASHELKTPITSLKLYLDSLAVRLTTHDERIKKTIESLRYQTNRLQVLVNDLLDVSRLQTGKLSLSQEYFRLDTLIKETIDELTQTTGDHSISFAHTPRIKIRADRFRIYQVLTNLLTNAIKYSPPGSDIVVNLQRRGNKVIVSVQDFGLGIDPDQKKRIFDRLYQITESTGKTFPGLGLGLYISKEIIKKHKGKIWVESKKGEGSTFYFSLLE